MPPHDMSLHSAKGWHVNDVWSIHKSHSCSDHSLAFDKNVDIYMCSEQIVYSRKRAATCGKPISSVSTVGPSLFQSSSQKNRLLNHTSGYMSALLARPGCIQRRHSVIFVYMKTSYGGTEPEVTALQLNLSLV